jgi:hypothetical protein
MLKHLFISAIGLFCFFTNSSAEQLVLLSNSNAEKAAAYINSQKEIILFCVCCNNAEPLKVKVAEAAVEKYKNYGTGVRLKGSDQYKNTVNKFVDLAHVWVKAKGSALNLGKVMNLRCEPCASSINWKSMKIETTSNRKQIDSKSRASISHIQESLTGNDSYGHVAQGISYRVYETRVDYDSTLHILQIQYKLYHKGFHTFQYYFDFKALGKIKAKKGYLIIRPRKGLNISLSFRPAGSYIDENVELQNVRIDMPEGVSAKALKKDLKKIKRRTR